MTLAFVVFITAGIRHEQNLYIVLIDATTKKVRFLFIGPDFVKLNFGPKFENRIIIDETAHIYEPKLHLNFCPLAIALQIMKNGRHIATR